MAQFSSYIEGPRWAGAETAILDYCYSRGIKVTTKAVNGWITSKTYFTVEGSETQLSAFKKYLIAAVNEYNR